MTVGGCIMKGMCYILFRDAVLCILVVMSYSFYQLEPFWSLRSGINNTFLPREPLFSLFHIFKDHSL